MINDRKTVLTERLLKVAGYIREGAVLCDVGCDHAKLPIYLIGEGKIKLAYATDINQGPIESAMKNIAELGYSDSIKCILTDGLSGTEGLGITDISICGMGGELIARILDGCTYAKDEKLNFILQPMTHTHDLRKYLYDNGYEIYEEALISETDKLYTVICAKYTGTAQKYSEAELYLGKVLLGRERDALFEDMLERVFFHLENKQKSTSECERMHAIKLAQEIEERLKR